MLTVRSTIAAFFTALTRSQWTPTAFLITLAAPVAFTQEVVSLLVTDRTGAAIRNANVVAISAHGETLSSLITDDEGRAVLPCQSGAQIQARALGFETRVASAGACGQALTFRLAPASVETTINVTVTADTAPNEPTVNSSSISRTTARTVFDAIEDLSPAIFVTRRGVMGYGISTNGTGQVSIRGVGGAPNTDVLMVLDGRPDFQGEMGHTLPDFYSLSYAGSIRVIEGPASVL